MGYCFWEIPIILVVAGHVAFYMRANKQDLDKFCLFIKIFFFLITNSHTTQSIYSIMGSCFNDVRTIHCSFIRQLKFIVVFQHIHKCTFFWFFFLPSLQMKEVLDDNNNKFRTLIKVVLTILLPFKTSNLRNNDHFKWSFCWFFFENQLINFVYA